VYVTKAREEDKEEDKEEETDPKKPRIVEIGLNQLRYYPNEQRGAGVKREYPAHIFTHGEWRLDTVDPPRNERVIADRWERYDRRMMQQIIPRVYVLPRDVEEWRQILIARDIDVSPGGRINWSRVQNEYADRFRTFLEDPIVIDCIIVCVHDGVTNICDFQQDHDNVFLRETPPVIIIPRDRVQETVEEINPVESDIDYNALLNTPETPEVKSILDVKEEPEEKKEDKKESTTKSFSLN
jgi:hypothetical protein